MKRIRIVFWGIKQVIKINPIRFMVNLIINVVTALFPTFIAIETGKIINGFQSSNIDANQVLLNLTNLAMLLFIDSFMYYAGVIITSALNGKTGIKIQKFFIELAESVPLKEFDDSDFYDEFSNAKDGINSLVDVTDSVILFISEIIGLISAMVAIAKVFPWLLIVVVPIYVWGFYLNMKCKKTSFDHWKDTTQQRRMCGYLSGLLFSKNHAKEMRSLDCSDFFFKKWKELREKLRKEDYLINKKSNKLFAQYQLFMDAMNLIVLMTCLALFSLARISLGQILTIWQLNKNLLFNVQSVNSSYSDIYYNNEKLMIAKGFIDKYKKKDLGCLTSQTISMRSVFSLKNVSFSYGDHVALSNINIEIKEGEIVAICGDNGSGKSTLIKLLCGLYAPNEGKITVMGMDLVGESLDISDYIGVTYQDFICYPYSIRENIGIGAVKSIANDAKILQASVCGDFDKKIAEIGNIDCFLGRQFNECGVELSGGEWQRVALSRAYMDDKSILIFDEPASKLDPVSELNQFKRVRRFLNDKTAILVSHRIGFARLASRIIVLKNGEVVEDGTHEQLLLKNGEYARLFNEQKQWYYSKGVSNDGEE